LKVTIASVRGCSIREEYGAPLALGEIQFRKGSDDGGRERVTGGKNEGD